MYRFKLSSLVLLTFALSVALPAIAQEDPPELLSSTEPVYLPDGNLISSMHDVVFDDVGNMYAVSSFKSLVVKYDADGVYVETFGSGRGTGDGQFDAPENLALDAAGNIFVSDKDNHRVQKFSSTGVFQFAFGGLGSGDGQLMTPRGIAVHPNGDIYVCDWGNHRMQVFDSAGTYKFKWGVWGSEDDNFIGVQEVDFDADGNVLTVEWDQSTNRIKRMNPNGVFIEEVYRFAGVVLPIGMDVGPTGTIWVVSLLNGSGTPTAFKIDQAGNLLTSWYAPNVRGIQESVNGTVVTSNSGVMDIWGPSSRVATEKTSLGSLKSMFR